MTIDEKALEAACARYHDAWDIMPNGAREPLRRFMRAAILAYKAAESRTAAPPVGWKMVPTMHNGRAGPTTEMADVFWRTWTEATRAAKHGFYESFYRAYNAMLAAAPPPPVGTTEAGQTDLSAATRLTPDEPSQPQTSGSA